MTGSVTCATLPA